MQAERDHVTSQQPTMVLCANIKRKKYFLCNLQKFIKSCCWGCCTFS